MISDDFKVREIAEAYSVISKSSAYYIGIWNSKELTFTKDDKILPLFIGSVVYTEKNEDIRGIISFNRKEQKCEISHAYPDLSEDTVWKLDYGRYGCMADKRLTIGRVDAQLASDLRDSERAFNLLFDDVISSLNNPKATGLTDAERRVFLEAVSSCVDSREAIEIIFIVSLMMERYEHVHFHVIEKIVMAACIIMNRFIYYNADHECRCECLDEIVEKSIGKAMEEVVKENPEVYGMEGNAVKFNADFVEKVYGGFKKIFRCFYPRIKW